MLRKSIYVITLCAHAALAAVLDPDGPATARKLSPRQADGVEFNPTLEPFVRVTPSFWFPYNVTTPTGVVASIPNCQGGTVTGAFEADILPAGTSFEQVAPDMTYGEHTVRTPSGPDLRLPRLLCVIPPVIAARAVSVL